MKNGSPSRTRTSDPAVNSRLLYQLSYRGLSLSLGLAKSRSQYQPEIARSWLQSNYRANLDRPKSGGIGGGEDREGLWRPRPESNRDKRICSPLRQPFRHVAYNL